MKPRPPLKPGDRCAIYREGYREVGDVCEIFPDGAISVRVTGIGFLTVHPKQCRRLKPPKPPALSEGHTGECRPGCRCIVSLARSPDAPDAGNAPLREVWISADNLRPVFADAEGNTAFVWSQPPGCADFVRFVECPHGTHAVVSIEALDEIMRELKNVKAHLESDSRGKEPYYGNTIWRISCALGACAALGLDKGEGGAKG